MQLPLTEKQDEPILDNSENIPQSKEEKPGVDFSTDMLLELPENHNLIIKVK